MPARILQVLDAAGLQGCGEFVLAEDGTFQDLLPLGFHSRSANQVSWLWQRMRDRPVGIQYTIQGLRRRSQHGVLNQGFVDDHK
jgi:hypothetical protein